MKIFMKKGFLLILFWFLLQEKGVSSSQTKNRLFVGNVSRDWIHGDFKKCSGRILSCCCDIAIFYSYFSLVFYSKKCMAAFYACDFASPTARWLPYSVVVVVVAAAVAVADPALLENNRGEMIAIAKTAEGVHNVHIDACKFCCYSA